MTFDEKVKILRSLPSFRVAPVNEVRAIAFAALENVENPEVALNNTLSLTLHDVEQILHEYPHLKDDLVSKSK